MTKADIIKEFTLLKGVGEAKAELLYKNGFNSLDKLKNASVKDLVKVKGITKKNAEDILNQLKVEKQDKPKAVAKPKKVKKVETKEKKPKKEPEEEKPAEEEPEVEIVEEKEEKYKVKKKPELSKTQKEKLAVRKQIKNRTPEFLREEWFRYKRVPKNWRRPDGITSKMRINLKYRPSKVRVGFGGPKEVRGLHPSGFEEVIVHNTSDLEKIDPKRQAARIGSTVGTKKRLDIAKKAEELEIRLLNMRV